MPSPASGVTIPCRRRAATRSRIRPPAIAAAESCIEAWCSGPALSAQFERRTGRKLVATEIAAEAERDDARAVAFFDLYLDRFARAIATLVNILDPDAIVIGGGLSKMDILYRELPAHVEAHAFFPQGPSLIVKNRHGDSSGVRGAAWLWPEG